MYELHSALVLMFLRRSGVSASQQHVVFFWKKKMYMLRDSTDFNSRHFLFFKGTLSMEWS